MAAQQSRPVMFGSLTASLMGELGMLTGELAARRTFDEDVAAWLEAHPDLGDAFRDFQEHRAAARAKSAPRAKNAL